MYKTQLPPLSADIFRSYTGASQRITKAPGMSLPPHLPHILAPAARIGALRRSEVWTQVNQRIEEAAWSNEAMLKPRRGWHTGSVV